MRSQGGFMGVLFLTCWWSASPAFATGEQFPTQPDPNKMDVKAGHSTGGDRDRVKAITQVPESLTALGQRTEKWRSPHPGETLTVVSSGGQKVVTVTEDRIRSAFYESAPTKLSLAGAG
jgi:hypothetical protein